MRLLIALGILVSAPLLGCTSHSSAGAAGDAGEVDLIGSDAGALGDGRDDGPRGDGPQSCTSNAECGPGGVCAGPGVSYCQPGVDNGAAAASDDRCLSGIRTPAGICCDRRCDGPCESCVGQASCTPRPTGAPCAEQGSCATDPTTGVESFTGPRCDGLAGSCGGPTQSEDCLGYRCTSSGCLRRCLRHDDCLSGICERWSDDLTVRDHCVDAAQICYVDAAAAAGGDGSADKPFVTIGGCLAVKAPWIVVAAGSYPEDLDLSYDVTIIGRGAGGLRDAAGHVKPLVEVGAVFMGVTVAAGRTIRLAGLRFDRAASATPGPVFAEGRAARLDLEELHFGGTMNVRVLADSVSINAIEAAGPTLSVIGDRITLKRLRFEGVFAEGLYIAAPGGQADVHDVAFQSFEGGMFLGENMSFRATKLAIDNMYYAGLTIGKGARGSVANVLMATRRAGGIAVSEGAVVDLLHVTLLGSKFQDSTFLRCDPKSTTRIINSIVWSAGDVAPGGKDCTFINSVVGFGDASNPLLSSSHVPTVYSPCLDAGTDAVTGVTFPTKDFAGNPRQVQLSPQSLARSDLGAFERQP